jgi:hypothetical protein
MNTYTDHNNFIQKNDDDNKQHDGGNKRTLTDRIVELENTISHLHSLIAERIEFNRQSTQYCKNNAAQNEKLSFIVDAYNNSYMRIIDDKIQQMQQLAKLDGYLQGMIENGNYSIGDIKRARQKQQYILERINETRASLEQAETLLALQSSNL